MIKPTALVIGPMKAGTTSIHEYLAWRGDVCLPRGVKETLFFDQKWAKGISWYSKHFREYDPDCHSAIVEVAPSLFHSDKAPDRVSAALGQLSLIVTTRDPVIRSWSHYQHLRRRGYTNEDLPYVLDQFPAIVEASKYDYHVARWKEALPNAKLTILALEDLADDRDGYVRKLCEAIDLPYRAAPAEVSRSNAGGVPPSFWLAKSGRKTAATLRNLGGYSLVNLAKRVGLKRVFFGSDGGKKLTPTSEEQEILARRIRSNR